MKEMKESMMRQMELAEMSLYGSLGHNQNH